MLLLIVGGIALTQAVSDPRQVTLRWLRLGGVIALSLLAAAVTIAAASDQTTTAAFYAAFAAVTAAQTAQLIATQLGRRNLQRLFAGVCFVLACAGAVWLQPAHAAATPWPHRLLEFAVAMTSAGLLGGFLMTMLLGHAYLTAGGEMTQSPFLRLVWLLATLLLARAAVSTSAALWPFLTATDYHHATRMWNTVMVTARFAVGFAVPAVFIYMIIDCVRRRANQSATGILYVATVLVVLGEGIALALEKSTGLLF